MERAFEWYKLGGPFSNQLAGLGPQIRGLGSFWAFSFITSKRNIRFKKLFLHTVPYGKSFRKVPNWWHILKPVGRLIVPDSRFGKLFGFFVYNFQTEHPIRKLIFAHCSLWNELSNGTKYVAHCQTGWPVNSPEFAVCEALWLFR